MKRIIAVLILISAISILLLTYHENEEEPQGFTAYRLIAHAMGSIGEQPYTNAYEAMLANYEKGTRVFEIDLMLTEDRKVVARHEWTESMTQQLGQQDKLPDHKQAARLTHEEFINTPILEQYQPMDIEAIMDMMQHYSDMYIVTDTKEQEDKDIEHLLTEIVNAAEQRDRNYWIESLSKFIMNRCLIWSTRSILLNPLSIRFMPRRIRLPRSRPLFRRTRLTP